MKKVKVIMEVKLNHNSGFVETDAIRIKIHDKNFMIKQEADGLKLIEIDMGDILVRPYSGNSIIVVTRTK